MQNNQRLAVSSSPQLNNQRNTRKRLGLNQSCPTGFILRKPYYRTIKNTRGYIARRGNKNIIVKPKAGRVLIKAACVKNTARQGINYASPSDRLAAQLKRGELLRFGYQFRLPDENRHQALTAAIDAYGPLHVYHKLDAVSKVFANKKPQAAMIFAADRDWVAGNFSVFNMPKTNSIPASVPTPAPINMPM
jgi:hypothetical protein